MSEFFDKILSTEIEFDNPDTASCFDEVNLWSAPFGMTLLDNLPILKSPSILDLGGGTGFMSIELSQRYGKNSSISILDPWEEAKKRFCYKQNVYGLSNINFHIGVGEDMPFEDNSFDMVISNNGLNNCNDQNLVLKECVRTLKDGGYILTTHNLPTTMMESYQIMEKFLSDDELKRFDEHINKKRTSVSQMEFILVGKNFTIQDIVMDKFSYTFYDAEAYFNYYLFKLYFLSGWKSIIDKANQKFVFTKLYHEIDAQIKRTGKFTVTIPYVLFKARLNK